MKDLNIVPIKRLEESSSKGYIMDTSLVYNFSFQLLAKSFKSIFFVLLIYSGIAYGFTQIMPLGSFVSDLLIKPFVTAYIFLTLLGVAKPDLEVNPTEWIAHKASKILGLSLLYSVIFLVVLSPSLVALWKEGVLDLLLGLRDLEPNAPTIELAEQTSTVVLLNSILMVYLLLSFWWAPLLILFSESSILQSLDYSRKLVQKNFFKHLSLGSSLLFLFLAVLFVAGSSANQGSILSTIIGIVADASFFFYFYIILFSSFYLSFFGSFVKGDSEEWDKRIEALEE